MVLLIEGLLLYSREAVLDCISWGFDCATRDRDLTSLDRRVFERDHGWTAL